MTNSLSQQQQLALIKTWLKEKWLIITLPIVLLIIAYTGWSIWSNLQQAHSEAAATQFQQLINQTIPNEDPAKINAIIQSLSQSYADTPYASAARLAYAKALANSANKSNAIEHLLWVVNNESVELIRELATTRLARLYVDLNQIDTALLFIEEQLDTLTKASIISKLYIIQSDAFLKQQKISAARQSLNISKRTLPDNSPLKDLIDLKLNNMSNR